MWFQLFVFTKRKRNVFFSSSLHDFDYININITISPLSTPGLVLVMKRTVVFVCASLHFDLFPSLIMRARKR